MPIDIANVYRYNEYLISIFPSIELKTTEKMQFIFISSLFLSLFVLFFARDDKEKLNFPLIPFGFFSTSSGCEDVLLLCEPRGNEFSFNGF